MSSELSGMPSGLFQALPTSKILKGKSPKEPTTVLAGYVLHELPKDIKAWNDQTISFDELAARQTLVLEAERERLTTLTDNEQATLAQLDLLMMLGAYLPAKEAAYQYAPALLLELLERLSVTHKLPPRLTYEFIVDVNVTAFLQSGGNMHTFSTDLVERDFYLGHYLAEQHIRRSYEQLHTLLEQPDATDKHSHLQEVLTGLEQFTAYMAAFARLPAESYAYFRRFLVPYPDKIKNASGAFMPTPQLFETLLHAPGAAQTEYLRRNLRYFPRWAQEKLQLQVEGKEPALNVQSLLDQDALHLDAGERQLLDAIIEQFVRFKLTHIKVASSKIPEAFPKSPITTREDLRAFRPQLDVHRDGTGAKQGTGGFAPQDFLADGVRRLLDLQAQLRH